MSTGECPTAWAAVEEDDIYISADAATEAEKEEEATAEEKAYAQKTSDVYNAARAPDGTVPDRIIASYSGDQPGPGLVEIWPDRYYRVCFPGEADDPCNQAVPITVITPGTPAVRISDLISFTPTAPTQQMQPNGWMVRGLATN
ncbi:hypothetical protein E3T55_05235, partial [Cryobacterium frigoriphilum]